MNDLLVEQTASRLARQQSEEREQKYRYEFKQEEIANEKARLAMHLKEARMLYMIWAFGIITAISGIVAATCYNDHIHLKRDCIQKYTPQECESKP